jgi:hypothetical protein
MTTALAMSSGAPRIEPDVSRHSSMGPRSSGSGGGGGMRPAAGGRVHAPVGQTACMSQLSKRASAWRARHRLLQHRVAQHHRLAGQHVFDAL